MATAPGLCHCLSHGDASLIAHVALDSIIVTVGGVDYTRRHHRIADNALTTLVPAPGHDTLLLAADEGVDYAARILQITPDGDCRVLQTVPTPFAAAALGSVAGVDVAGVACGAWSADGLWYALVSTPYEVDDSHRQRLAVFLVGATVPAAVVDLPCYSRTTTAAATGAAATDVIRTVSFSATSPFQLILSSPSIIRIALWGCVEAPATASPALAYTLHTKPPTAPLPAGHYVPSGQPRGATYTSACFIPGVDIGVAGTVKGQIVALSTDQVRLGARGTGASIARSMGATTAGAGAGAGAGFELSPAVLERLMTIRPLDYLEGSVGGGRTMAPVTTVFSLLTPNINRVSSNDANAYVIARVTPLPPPAGAAHAVPPPVVSIIPIDIVEGLPGFFGVACADGAYRVIDSSLHIITCVNVAPVTAGDTTDNDGITPMLISLSVCARSPTPESEYAAAAADYVQAGEPVTSDALAAFLPPILVQTSSSEIYVCAIDDQPWLVAAHPPAPATAVAPSPLMIDDNPCTVVACDDCSVVIFDLTTGNIVRKASLLTRRLLSEDVAVLGAALGVIRDAADAARAATARNSRSSSGAGVAGSTLRIPDIMGTTQNMQTIPAMRHSQARAEEIASRHLTKQLPASEAWRFLGRIVAVTSANIALAERTPLLDACMQATNAANDTQAVFTARLRHRKHALGLPTTVSVQPVTNVIAVGTGAGHVVVLDARTLLPVTTLRPSRTSITQVVFSPDGAVLAVADASDHISVYTLEEGSQAGEDGSTWIYVGRAHAHHAAIVGMTFVTVENVQTEGDGTRQERLVLVSVGKDRRLVEIDITSSSPSQGLQLRASVSLRATPVSCALYEPGPAMPALPRAAVGGGNAGAIAHADAGLSSFLRTVSHTHKNAGLGPGDLPRATSIVVGSVGDVSAAHADAHDQRNMAPDTRQLLCIAYDDGKIGLRLAELEQWPSARTVLGVPTMRPPTAMQQVPLISCPETRGQDAPLEILSDDTRLFSQYMVCVSPARYVALVRTPIDGNLRREETHLVHASPLAGAAVTLVPHAGMYREGDIRMLTASSTEPVFGFWDVNLGVLDRRLAESGTVRLSTPSDKTTPIPPPTTPLAQQIDAETYAQLLDMFPLSCLRAEGEQASSGDRLLLPYMPDLCRGLGCFLSEHDFQDMVSELHREQNRLERLHGIEPRPANATKIDMNTFINAFINFRPLLPPSRDALRGALLSLGAEPVTGLIERSWLVESLLSTGDAFSAEELAQCLSVLLGKDCSDAAMTGFDNILPEQVGPDTILQLLGF